MTTTIVVTEKKRIPWFQVASVVNQPSMKYVSKKFAIQNTFGDLKSVLENMLCFSEERGILDPRIDVRYWKHLDVGEYPGLKHWHYDFYNTPNDPRGSDTEHFIFISGAGCRTEFRSGCIEENIIYHYEHKDEHRISPATISGPRVLIRVSRAPLIPFCNKTYVPYQK